MSKSYAKYIRVGLVIGHERRNANGKYYHKRIKILRNKNRMLLRKSLRDYEDFVEIRQHRENEYFEPTDGRCKLDYKYENIKDWGKIYVYKNKIKK